MDHEKCTSCHIEVLNQAGTVAFKCPSCAQTKIVRCPNCRQICSRYTCEKCSFTGPN